MGDISLFELAEGGLLVTTVDFADLSIIVGMSLWFVTCRPYSVESGIV